MSTLKDLSSSFDTRLSLAGYPVTSVLLDNLHYLERKGDAAITTGYTFIVRASDVVDMAIRVGEPEFIEIRNNSKTTAEVSGSSETVMDIFADLSIGMSEGCMAWALLDASKYGDAAGQRWSGKQTWNTAADPDLELEVYGYACKSKVSVDGLRRYLVAWAEAKDTTVVAHKMLSVTRRALLKQMFFIDEADSAEGNIGGIDALDIMEMTYDLLLNHVRECSSLIQYTNLSKGRSTVSHVESAEQVVEKFIHVGKSRELIRQIYSKNDAILYLSLTFDGPRLLGGVFLSRRLLQEKLFVLLCGGSSSEDYAWAHLGGHVALDTKDINAELLTTMVEKLKSAIVHTSQGARSAQLSPFELSIIIRLIAKYSDYSSPT